MAFNLLLVAGTHGNEINAPLLFQAWNQNPNYLKTNDFKIIQEIGNPLAFKEGKRYIHRDLNRSFREDLLNDSPSESYELQRAKELLGKYGSNGINPCKIAIDLHSTTAFMGSSLVIYGRRPTDLALASLIQFRLGIPIYLHEDDSAENGFLVESWPCGLVIEIGPVAQSLVNPDIIKKYKLILETCFEELEKVMSSKVHFPRNLIVYSHLGSIDFPRDLNDQINATIHPECYGKDWEQVYEGDPLFLGFDQKNIGFKSNSFKEKGDLFKIFINEAAYVEKRIAMSIAKREELLVQSHWKESLYALLNN